MKTHELAQHLDNLATLLRRMPDVELDSKPTSVTLDLFSSVVSTKKNMVKPSRQLPSDIHSRIAEMSPAEVEAFLLSETEGFTLSNLLELAEKIGLSSSKRQNKNALVNMIVRHYEALKMHSIMRDSEPSR